MSAWMYICVEAGIHAFVSVYKWVGRELCVYCRYANVCEQRYTCLHGCTWVWMQGPVYLCVCM